METCDFQVFLVEFRGSCQVPGLFSPTRVTGIELEWQAKHLLQPGEAHEDDDAQQGISKSSLSFFLAFLVEAGTKSRLILTCHEKHR